MHAGTLKAIVTTVVQAGLVLALMVSAASEVWTQRAAGPAPAAGRGGAPPPLGVPRAPLGDGPWVLDTAEQHKIKVSIVASGLVNPWSLAWLPDGSMLITERPGRLRLLKNGVLDPTPIAGLPAVKAQRLSGLMDVVLHPRFAENRLVYLTYNKGRASDGMMATALARGRLEGTSLTDVKELFVAEPWWDGAGGSASRIVFGRDGFLYMTTGSGGGANFAQGQEKNIHKGKILRLRDDGTVPNDNPFVKDPSFRPEIYSWGHRNSLALIVHPVTGELWNSENGPNGGDEVNVVKAGKNYGWPVVSLGRSYEGPWQGRFEKDGMEPPLVYWMPAVAASGMAVYTGDRFPAWKNNLFIGAMRVGEIPNTGHLQRVVFNEKTEEIRRESLLTELRQRIRDVRQGPDGLLYLLTDENPGALLKIEPAP
ncbi:MAG TPA: PQQ-dependent sugar dehydrogenase [Pseudolysinimonas sp.]|nr:PQQ-dependent sugar dehydrogenase [Pseudolysinimonas sp.]